MVIHAPPFNILCLPLLLLRFIPSEELKIKIMKWFSLGVFWLENIIGVTFFVAFELCLLPIVFGVCLFNIGCNTRGLFTTVLNIFIWCSVGLLILLCILCMDTFVLLKILAMHNGCKENEKVEKQKADAAKGEPIEVLKSKAEQNEDQRNNIVARMNEIREVVFQYYTEFSKKAKGDNTDEKKIASFATTNGNDTLNQDAQEGFDFIDHPNFTVKWFVIADKWR